MLKIILYKLFLVPSLTFGFLYFSSWHSAVCDLGINNGANSLVLVLFVLPITFSCLSFIAYICKSAKIYTLISLVFILTLVGLELYLFWDYPSPECINNLPWQKHRFPQDGSDVEMF